MYKTLPLFPHITKKLLKHSLTARFDKQLKLLRQNPRHPSLHIELLEPKQYGIYSFRIDRKYRALFIHRPDLRAIEILAITVHYK